MKTEDSSFRRFGLVGRNIEYSFSPQYFMNKFQKENIHAHYKIYDLKEIKDFPSIFLTKNLSGLNVTTPYKEEIMIFMDDLSEAAQKIGAVNTIQFKGDRLVGHNTDYIGFKNSLKPLLENHHKNALILGTGGASKAIQYALNELEISFKIVSRNPGKADFIYQDLSDEIISKYQIIINTTPIGTYPGINEMPNFPTETLGKHHLVFDLIYNPEKSLLLQKAEIQGAKTENGLKMLEIQADESWKLWNYKSIKR